MTAALSMISTLAWQIGYVGLVVLDFISLRPYILASLLLCPAAVMLCASLWSYFHEDRGARHDLLLLSSLLFGLTLSLGAYIVFPADGATAIILATLGYAQALLVSIILNFFEKTNSKDSEVTPVIRLSSTTKQQMLGPIASGMLLLSLALPIRLWELASFGRVHHAEQNITASLALRVIETGKPLFYTSFSLDPERFLEFVPSDNFMADPLAVLILLFGNSMITLKLISLMLGLLSIVLALFVGWRWFGPLAGMCSAFLLSMSPYMIGLSREVIYAYGLLVPYSLLTLHFLFLSFERPRIAAFACASALAYASFYIYFPAMVFFAMVLGSWCAFYLWDKKWRLKAARPMLFGSLISLPILFPYWYLMYRDDIYHYVGDISKYMNDESRLSGMPSFGTMILSALSDFWQGRFFVGEPMHFLAGVGHIWGYINGQHLPLEALLFFVGLGVLLLRLTTSRTQQLLFGLLILSILPGLLSSRTERRFLVEQVVFYLVSGQGAAWVLTKMYDGFAARRIGVMGFCLTPLFALYTAVSYGLFIDRAESTPRFYDREAAEEVVALLSQRSDVKVFLGWGGGDAATIPGLAYYLLWNKAPGRAYWIQQRLFSDFDNLLQHSNGDWDDKIKFARFYLRTDVHSKIWPVVEFKKAFKKQQISHPLWQVKLPLEALRGTSEQLFWLEVPREDFPAARSFLCETLCDCKMPAN